MTDDVRTIHTIVPASPGWYLSLFLPDDKYGPVCLRDHPIVAWDVERSEGPADEGWSSRSAMPVLLDVDDLSYFANRWVFKAPDGKYYTQDGLVVSNEADVLALFAAKPAAAPPPPSPPPQSAG